MAAEELNDKKIALVLPSYVGGGAEKISDIICSGLIERHGFTVELITGELNEQTRRRVEKVGYKITCLSAVGPDINSPEAEEAFLAAIKKSGAKHIVYSVVLPQAAGRYRRELPGRNIIYHLHSCPLWEAKERIFAKRRVVKALDSTPQYLSWYLSKYLKEKWFKAYTHRFAKRYRKLSAGVDHIVVLTDTYRRQLSKIIGKSPEITAIYNPFDPTALSPLAKVEKRKEIVYVGRLSCVDKGVDHLIRAWKRLYRNYPDWTLRIVGDGPDRGYLEWLATVLGIENIEFCGYAADPSEFYKTASIICLPSNFEGWGMAIIEAMAAGVVPVASDCSGGVREILDNGRGVLFKPGNDRALAKGLSSLMDNPEELAERRKLYPDFLKKFNANNAVDQFYKLLK